MAAQKAVSPGRVLWSGLIVVTIGLGLWGHIIVRREIPLTPMEVLYHTARLFTLNLDVDSSIRPPWQLWVAAVLAPVLLVRGLAELFRDRLHGITVRFVVFPHIVIVGADHRAAALARSEKVAWWRRWFRAVVVADPDPRRLATVREFGVWTVTADGLSAVSLRRAAVHRARNVVVVTGQDRRNAAIATEAQRVAARPAGRELYVEVDDPVLAQTLERSVTEDGTTTLFSGLALAGADVLDELDRRDGPLLDAGDEPPSMVLFGQGSLVDAMVLELGRRRRVQLLAAAPPVPPRPRVLIIGPDAERRRESVRALLGDEATLLDVDAVEDSLTQAVELRASTARALLGHRMRRVVVVADDDLSGNAMTLMLARHLGRQHTLTLVTAGPASTFGEQLQNQTTADTTLAPVRVFRVPDLAYSLPRLQEHRSVERLARALHESRPGQGRWATLAAPARRELREQAGELLDRIDVRLRGHAFMAFDPPQVRVLSGLGISDFTALARAGMSPDLRDPGVLVNIGKILLDKNQDSAFLAWCEAARLATTAAQLTGTDIGRGEDADDVRRLLLLRRAQLNDPNARTELAAVPVDPAPVGDLVVVVGGSVAGSAETLREVLGWALGAAPGFTGAVVEPAGTTEAGRVLGELAAAGGGEFVVHSPGADAAAARRHALALWTRLACGAPGTVRVLAVPGDATLWPQLQLLRTLGARIGWLPLASVGVPVPDPERQLLGGAAGVVELPVDRATVRAFLRPSRWPGTDADRDAVAAALHHAYVRRHGAHKPPGDPALRPFAQLSPALQDSNRSVVDDIPAKLAAAGLRLCALADASWPANWPDQATLDLLAEMEHGRWNAERLLAGWEAGVRDTARFVSPHLKPWDDLDEQTRGWDRDIVCDLPAVLEQAGLGACRR